MKFRYLWLIPALLPLLAKCGYLLDAWRISPLDRLDWSFFLLVPVLAFLKRRAIRSWCGAYDPRGFFFFAPALLVWGAGIWKHVNAVEIGGAILVFFSLLFVLGGVRLFSGLLPLLLIMLLGVPSTTYWSEYYLRASVGVAAFGGTEFKFTAAACLAAYFLVSWRIYRLQTLLFLLGFLLLVGILLGRQTRAIYGHPLLVDTERMAGGEFVGYPRSLTEMERRFFAGHEMRRFSYYDHSGGVQLLAVGITGSIHSIHPAELCLKSQNSKILSMRELHIPTAAGRLAVQEVVVAFPDGGKQLLYTWYVSGNWSSGNFLAFRRSWHRGGKWYTYQLSTPITTTRERAEERLDAFLEQFLIPLNAGMPQAN
ncbi:MAG: hypothetical protein HPZ91_18485 [Lentisphaeria bacterium]|nr:hypothetical protein [Lentisphaeria bacterium]